MRYLADKRPPREPQNHYMAIGSSFDAHVKSYLYAKLVGKNCAKHEFQYMFETQVEAHNRDRALKDGKHLFDYYAKSGALEDLIEDMRDCVGEPKFEDSLTGLISASGRDEPVPILGKPDIYFIHRAGGRVIFDWKCSGYYSAKAPSPKAGYLKLYPGKHMHKDCNPYTHKGFTINSNRPMNMVDYDWAAQTSTYAWVLGQEVGSDFISVIDYYCCNAQTKEHRIARNQAIVQDGFQYDIYDKYLRCWKAIQTGHIFLSMSYEQSVMKCRTIDKMLETPGTVDPVFNELTATSKRVR